MLKINNLKNKKIKIKKKIQKLIQIRKYNKFIEILKNKKK